MLGDADPVEAERLDEFEPLDHPAIGAGARVGIVDAGGHRPLRRQRLRGLVTDRFEERDLHGGRSSRVTLARAGREGYAAGARPWQNDGMPATEPARVPEFLYGTAWKEDRTPALTEEALRAGFRGIDTANQRRHYFEAGVGQALAAAYRDGIVTRAELLRQPKFAYEGGQDHRLPYDPAAPLSTQVAQSMASSLEHLGTDHVDSYVLHGPAAGHGWTDADSEVWEAMRKERDAGRTRLLGVSNVSLRHLQQMMAAGAEPPAFVQNRCFARLGWDRAVRAFCQDQTIRYQGFSLLTANLEFLRDPRVTGIAARARVTVAQVVFRFAQVIGMLPLTGTSDAAHMKQDLAARDLSLSADEVRAIESLAG